MDYTNNTTESRKNKHLNFEERMTIQIRLKDGFSPYKIAKELKRPLNTIQNEIKRGTVPQIKQNKKVMVYLADAGNAVYQKNRSKCGRKFRRLTCDRFISYVTDKMKSSNWSVDASVGEALVSGSFTRDETVCTKTIYNYIDLGLMEIKNADLPMKLRINTKPKRIRASKRKLGESIENRPDSVNDRTEFGHWEIDTVIGKKTSDDCVLLTLAERHTRNFIVRKISSKSSAAVMQGIEELRSYYGDRFNQVFKSITSDNGLEFADLHTLDEIAGTKVYFTHPYSSSERGTNERHNGLIRRFIPKGTSISSFSVDKLFSIEYWCNTLPRKILGYRTPEELFEEHLDLIYAT